jgi:hypothetical protein
VTSDEFKAFLDGGTVRLIVRCLGNNGHCGRVHAAFDDAGRVYYNPAHKKHDVGMSSLHGDEWELRRDIFDAFHNMTAAERRSAKPNEIKLVPEPYRLRKNHEQASDENWAHYLASGERPGVEEDEIFLDDPNP